MLAVNRKTAVDGVKRLGNAVQSERTRIVTLTAEAKTAADAALIAHNGISARLTEIAQRMARVEGIVQSAMDRSAEAAVGPEIASMAGGLTGR